jgi:dihydroorotate dehydrogenase (NAD+) catalytic subunit
MNLKVQLAPNNGRGLILQNPVMTASGTFGYGIEYAKFFDINELGAIVCKATTLLPRTGNREPRVAETIAGMLNSIGLQNEGVKVLIAEKAPEWTKLSVPVIVNIAGESVADYAELARLLDGVPGVAGLEVNISCPNVAEGGAAFGADCASSAKVTAAVRKATSLPVMVKLTPNVTDIVQVAKAVEEAGADSISLINTLKAISIDIQRRKPLLGNVTGGLSGPAVKPVALCMVYEVSKAVKIPVVGLGGIMTGEDAIEFIMAGATAVQIGTANFTNPTAALDILKGIEKFLDKEGVANVNEIIGAARR